MNDTPIKSNNRDSVIRMSNPIKNVKKIDSLKQKKLQAKLINHITSVYFFFTSGDEDFEETDIDDFILDNWDNAIITAAALGLRVIGETEDGKIVAELKPVESVKKFLIDGNWGGEEDIYMEDIDEEDVTASPEEIDWGQFSEIFD
jgi:hypothetical protein